MFEILIQLSQDRLCKSFYENKAMRWAIVQLYWVSTLRHTLVGVGAGAVSSFVDMLNYVLRCYNIQYDHHWVHPDILTMQNDIIRYESSMFFMIFFSGLHFAFSSSCSFFDALHFCEALKIINRFNKYLSHDNLRIYFGILDTHYVVLKF